MYTAYMPPSTHYDRPCYQGPYPPRTSANTDFIQPNTTGPQITRIERPAGFPPGAPETPDMRARSDSSDLSDLFNYRVSPRNLDGLQPDRYGIFTRNNSNRTNSYFTKIDEDVYQLGGFDRQSQTWRVLDPRSGQEVATLELERKDGKWLPKNLGKRMLRALDGAIENVRRAKAQIGRAWMQGTNWAMQKLFGGGAFTPQGRQRIEAGLNNTLQALEKSKREGAWNLRVGHEGGPNRPAAVAFNNGTIQFSRYALRNWSDPDLNELMVHEHTHTGAGARDHWYLNRNHDRLPNWGGGLSPFTFNNALNNADTLARSSGVLANN
ncbi:MAG TPA: hypothetical protein VMA74_11800 [Dyella sp.]|uniref:hypothetical protein n=1 Tax=Dyella sp. TaxID=1869338 RepID=UPI002CA98C19|nr:hypothetical protein [Dyella sp.]HUB90398.1 hypothetical protein [Dyella sp.]